MLLDLAARLEAERNEWKHKVYLIAAELGFPGGLEDGGRFGTWFDWAISAVKKLTEEISYQKDLAYWVRIERDHWQEVSQQMQRERDDLKGDLEAAQERLLDVERAAKYNADCTGMALADLEKVTRQRDQAQGLIRAYVDSNTRRVREDFRQSLYDQGYVLDNWNCPECGTANGWTSIWCCLCGRYKDSNGIPR